MAEYVLHPDDNPADVARALLDKASDPSSVMWSPRPDVPGGGVYVVNNEETVAEVSRQFQQQRDAEAKRIADAQAAAEERDAKADETGLTPAQLGFPANMGTDPGAPGTAGVLATDEAARRGDGLLAPEIAQTQTTQNADGTVSASTEPVAPSERVGDVDGPDSPVADPDEDDAADDPSTAEDESKMTPAQRRAAKRKAAAEAAADAAATQEETK